MTTSFNVARLSTAHELSEVEWRLLDTGDDPFISRAFLGAVEQTGAAGPDLGWQPRHLVFRDGEHGLVGLLPLYLRQQSFGDFSHDWRWAQAWQDRGLDYYPKLVTGVPYTPSPGPRLLVTKGASDGMQAAMVQTVLDLARELAVSSWQCLFVKEHERDLLAAAGMLIRRGVQFHWLNRGYGDFEDFLSGFAADKRKKLKRERRAVRDAGLRIETMHSDEVNAELWHDIHRHYRNTFMRHGNHPALSEMFFRQVAAELGRRMVLFVAYDGVRAVASAICYRDDAALYGRHWGTDGAYSGLHFELCFYQGIEYAIAEGLSRFEPGAQGEHKLARGFEPVDTWSAFWIADPHMRQALATFLERESRAVQDYQAGMAQHLPYKAVP